MKKIRHIIYLFLFAVSLSMAGIHALAAEKVTVYMIENFNKYNTPGKAPSGFELTGAVDKEIRPIEDDGELLTSVYLNVPTVDGTYYDIGIARSFGEALTGDLILDFKLKPLSNNGILFIEMKGSNGKALTLGQLNANGTLKFGTGSTRLELNQWYQIAICVNFDTKVLSVYVNNNLAIENAVITDPNNITDLNYFRLRGRVTQDNYDFIVDDFRIYSGTTPLTLEELEGALKEETPFDFDNYLNIDISDIMEESIALVVNSEKAVVFGDKVDIDETGEVMPVMKDNQILLPLKFIVTNLGGSLQENNNRITSSLNGIQAVIDDNILTIGSDTYEISGMETLASEILVPIDIIELIGGKKVYTDKKGRGLVIIGDNEAPFDDSLDIYDSSIKNEDSEKFRIEEAIKQVVYDRPEGAAVIEQLQNNSEHPRILAASDDFTRIKELIRQGDPIMTKWYQDVLADGEVQLQLALPTDDLPDGRRMISSRQIGPLVTTLAFLYQVSDDEAKKIEYQDRIWAEVEAVAGFSSWNENNEFLNTAEFIEGMSIAYDWMYHEWTEEQREIIADAIINKGLVKGLEAYKNNVWWNRSYPMISNWNAVCNGSIGIGVMALGDLDYSVELPNYDDPVSMQDLAAKLIECGFNGLENYLLLEFTPDGAWAEGPSYWEYTLEYLVKYMAALESAVGTSYGHADTPGLDKTAYFPFYLTGEVGSFNYGDAETNKIVSSEVFWLAKRYEDQTVTTMQINNMLSSKSSGTALSMLWYEPDNYVGEVTIAPDNYFRSTEIATFRSRWNDANGIFLGFKAGSNVVSHGHYDLGTFVLEALGEQWAIDLGKDDYNLTGYFNYSAERLTYYRLNPEGHNTLVFNPDGSAQQNINAFTKIENYVSKDKGGFAIADLTNAYDDAISVRRGVMLDENRTKVTIRDEVTLNEDGTAWWFMHTKANIEILKDGSAARLTLNDKYLWIELDSDKDAHFTVMDASPLSVSPNPSGQNKNEGIRKLAIELNHVEDYTLTIQMIPMLEKTVPDVVFDGAALSEWTIPDGSFDIPELEEISINGESYSDFNKAKYSYSYDLPLHQEEVPLVTATADERFLVEIIPAEDIPGTTRIKVSLIDDVNVFSVYTINFKLVPDDTVVLEDLEVVSITASSSQTGNVPENAIDNNYSTYWAGEGEQWIELELGQVERINAVAIAFIRGNERVFSYKIELSTDGVNWKSMASGESSGESTELETVFFKSTEAQYIRITGYGNSINRWNSYSEIRIRQLVITDVDVEVTGINISGSSLVTASPNETIQLSVQVSPENATDTSLTYTSSSERIATVSEDGAVTAVSSGFATITAAANNGKKATIMIRVV